MTFKDWTQSLWDKVKTSGGFGPDGSAETNMPHGGSCGYRPNTAKHRTVRETARQTPVTDMPQNTDAPGWGQPGAYTGFQQAQGTGYQQPQGTGYQQPVDAAYTGYQPPFTGYQPPVNAWAQQQPQQPGYDAGQNFGGAAYGYQGGYQDPGMNGTGYVPPQPNAAPNNIRYMPNTFVGDDQQAYRHSERIAVVTTVSTCYRLIEFMRNGESIIVNTEQITDEVENQRCLDLLYGAAYAMRCSFTRIASQSIYLIAPSYVLVQPYDTIDRMSEQDINHRWPGSRQSQWESSYREESNGFTHSHPSYAASRGWQDDHAGFSGYRAVGYNR